MCGITRAADSQDRIFDIRSQRREMTSMLASTPDARHLLRKTARSLDEAERLEIHSDQLTSRRAASI